MEEKFVAYKAALRAETEAHTRLAKAQEHGSGEEVVEAVIEAKEASIKADILYHEWQVSEDYRS
jgi:hypothetical protein